MSLIHNNPWLVERLLKTALEDDKKLSKKAQTDPDELKRQNIIALQQQIKALQDQLNPQAQVPSNPNEISTQGAGAALKMPDLQSLGSLVMFVDKNKITVGGKRIAYGSDDPEFKTDDESYELYQLEGSATLIPVRSGALDQAKLSFRINKDLLVKYLQSLQALSIKQKNPMLAAPLKSIIQEANEQLQTNVGKYQEPAEPLPENVEVDRLPRTLDLKSWGQDGQDAILTTSDIASLQSLNAWFDKYKLSVQPSKGGNPVTIREQDFDQCVGIKVLAMRAQRNVQRSTSDKAKATATIYLRQMTAIATEAHCDLSQVGIQSGQQSAQQGTGLSTEVLQELAQELPFNSQYINFQQIAKFVDKYASLANNQTVSAAADQVHKAIDMANEILATPDLNIQLNNVTTERFKLLTKNANQAKWLANYLYTLVSVAGRIYQDFVISYQQTYE